MKERPRLRRRHAAAEAFEDEFRALDKKLDEALEQTFPASDPPAVLGDIELERRL